MSERRISLGIDIGSVSVKVVLVQDGDIVRSFYRRFQGSPLQTLECLLEEEFSDLRDQTINLGITGIGGKVAQSILGGRFFGEISALAAGNFRVVPDVRTVIEMGGEDSKLLLLDRDRQVISDFAMNAQCAAGTGSFLDQQAGRLKINIEDEFGELALRSKNPPRIAGRCSVFAKTDMIHLQQIATPDYDIVAGLCFAVARNFKSSIARGKEFTSPVAFEGGVAANPGMVRAFTEVLGLRSDELIVPKYFNVIGAVGAAFLAADGEELVNKFDSGKIIEYLEHIEPPKSDRKALSFNSPDTKHYDVTLADRPAIVDGVEVFLGIDIGSLSTNLVLIDRDHQVIARRYLMTEGRPIEAVRRGLAEISEEVGDRVTVASVATTGSGRYLIGDFVGADIVRNEITAQATAAVSIDPTVDTVFEIGGQDSKYISIDNQAVVDFEMNKACAAGTGSFLQEQAEKLDINIKQEFGDRALRAKCPVGCGERCTVFMESDLVAHQRQGATKDDLIAGLAYSIVSNYLTKVVGDRRIGDNIFFQGGTAWNKAVVAAFEQLIGKTITVPPHHDVTGAIGAAILAIEKADEKDFATSFRGFDVHKRKYEVSSFTCDECDNCCEIHKVELENEEPLYYGSRCEKYDQKSHSIEKQFPDYVKLRQKLLYRRYVKSKRHGESRGRVGIPRVLHFLENYPFWLAFFESLGFKVVNSNISNARITDDALKLFTAETCYPIKLVYGHIANLLEKNVDFIFLPTLIKVAEESEEPELGAYICPYVQSISSSVKARFNFNGDQPKLIDSPISLSCDADDLKQSLRPLGKDLNLSDKEFHQAVEAGLVAYRTYKKSLHQEGDRILSELQPDEKAIVVVSRVYNGYDPKLSLEIPKKIRNLGYKAIPVDFLRCSSAGTEFPYMYWRYGKNILSGADEIRKHPNLFAVYITSFGCGPDSFITHFFHRSMAGKPYLQLELDEHSADAGIITRCEAFIDSLRLYQYKPPVTTFNLIEDKFRPFEKTIYIPNMCDHAWAIRASLERFGLTAEVLDEPDDLTLNYGKKFTSGKECFPCIVTTGDMIKKLRSEGFDRSRAVFLMPGASGPCRFGLYRQLHRLVLDDLGFNDIPIFSPMSQDGYTDFGLSGTDFRTVAWRGLVFIDCLAKLLYKTRPYERESGKAEKLYYHYLHCLDQAIVKDEPLDKLAEKAAKDFTLIPVRSEHRPLVGVVGEIYLRHNRFSNNHLLTNLERAGLEVRLATFSEWPMYTSWTFRRDSVKSRDFKGMLKSSLQLLMQSRHERKLVNAFAKHFKMNHEFPVGRVIDVASKYLSVDVRGEAILSVGKAIEMAQQGAVGIVNAMPFNCMPGTIVSSLSETLSSDLGRVPWLNISYEGLRDSGEETRLEAFAEQVRVFQRLASASVIQNH